MLDDLLASAGIENEEADPNSGIAKTPSRSRGRGRGRGKGRGKGSDR